MYRKHSTKFAKHSRAWKAETKKPSPEGGLSIKR